MLTLLLMWLLLLLLLLLLLHLPSLTLPFPLRRRHTHSPQLFHSLHFTPCAIQPGVPSFLRNIVAEFQF